MLIPRHLCPEEQSIQSCIEDISKDVAAAPAVVPDLKLESIIGLPLDEDALKLYTVPIGDGVSYLQSLVVESEGSWICSWR